MFRHVVMFQWAEGVGDDHVARVAAELDHLVEVIPEIRGYRHGRDAGVNAGNFDYVVVGDFDSVDGYLAYRDHPVHQAFVRDLIAGKIAGRAAVQYDIGD